MKHRRQNLNRPLLHRGGGNGGGGDGASVDSRDRDHLRRDKRHVHVHVRARARAHAHNLDQWSTSLPCAGAAHPHHNDRRLADSQRAGLEDSLSYPLLRQIGGIGWIVSVEDEYIVEDNKDSAHLWVMTGTMTLLYCVNDILPQASLEVLLYPYCSHSLISFSLQLVLHASDPRKD